MSSTFGFETQDDRRKRREQEEGERRQQAEDDAATALEVAENKGNIIEQILTDFAKAQGWERDTHTSRETIEPTAWGVYQVNTQVKRVAGERGDALIKVTLEVVNHKGLLWVEVDPQSGVPTDAERQLVDVLGKYVMIPSRLRPPEIDPNAGWQPSTLPPSF